MQACALPRNHFTTSVHSNPEKDENVTTQKIISFLQSALMLLKELYENNVGSRYICKGLLLRIFRIMSSKYEFSLSREQRKTMNWILFEEVTGYIQQNYAHVTIQDLVREFHFQEDYFNRLIKSRTDMTYSAYVQQIRLEHAERLLLAGGKTIDEIARIVRCGICPHPLYEKGGVSPSSF